MAKPFTAERGVGGSEGRSASARRTDLNIMLCGDIPYTTKQETNHTSIPKSDGRSLCTNDPNRKPYRPEELIHPSQTSIQSLQEFANRSSSIPSEFQTLCNWTRLSSKSLYALRRVVESMILPDNFGHPPKRLYLSPIQMRAD